MQRKEANTQRKDLSTRKETIINLGVIGNKTCILPPKKEKKREDNKFHKTPSK